MRIFIVLVCSLALVSVAYSAQQEENKQKKKQPQTVQHAPPSATGRPTSVGAGSKKTSMGAYQGKKGQTSMGAYEGGPGPGAHEGQKGKKGQTSVEAGKHPGGVNKADKQKKAGYVEAGKHPGGVNKPGQQEKAGYVEAGKHPGGVNKPGQQKKAGYVEAGKHPAEVGPGILTHPKGKPPKLFSPDTGQKPTGVGKTAVAGGAGKPFKPQHFNVPKQPNTAKAPPVKFQQGKHIEGSQNWQGQNYTVFRNYKSEWHDQNWWHSHHNRIVFVFGSPYYWNAGYWFPAWGYNPNAYYAWDGPIYGYNHLPPDQVIANAQAALQQQGYYQGEVDGLLGPLTRDAIANYQRDHGLYTTSTIDQPTLQSLGMA